MTNQYIDTIIIGAGVSGLALANLCAQQRKSFLCLEAHVLPGGCASFFKREGLSFDVGATTLSGMAYQGPLSQFIDRVCLDVELRKVDPGLTIQMGDNKFLRYANLERWTDQLESIWPKVDHKHIWQEIDRLNQKCWSVIDAAKYYPPKSMTDIFHLGQKDILKKLSLLRPALTSFYDVFLKNKDIDKDYLRLIDELLLIASQNDTHKTPALLGALALSYTNDTWYPQGGVGNFSRQLLSNAKKSGGDFLFNCRVDGISKESDILIVQTSRGAYKCKNVVSTVPLWNTLKMAGELKPPILAKQVSLNRPKWGAITGYFAVKLRNSGEGPYHQVHLEKRLSHAASNSIFISISPEDDSSRNKGPLRPLSVSSHIDLKEYERVLLTYGEGELKKRWSEELEVALASYFKEDLLDIKNLGIGDPKTFHKYTLRESGSVGGASP